MGCVLYFGTDIEYNDVHTILRVGLTHWYEPWSSCSRNWVEKSVSQHPSNRSMSSKTERTQSIESQMDTVYNRTTTWSFRMLMSTTPTRNSTQIRRSHKREPRSLRKWIGPCPCSYFTSERTLSTTTLPTIQSCSDLDTRDCSMTSSKEANFQTISVCTSTFQL